MGTGGKSVLWRRYESSKRFKGACAAPPEDPDELREGVEGRECELDEEEGRWWCERTEGTREPVEVATKVSAMPGGSSGVLGEGGRGEESEEEVAKQ